MRIPEKLLVDGYILKEEFNPGGQSRTFLVSKGETLFLLKRPKTEQLSKEQKFRFEQEAKALTLIEGNGVPKVYDYFFDSEPFILMEYIQGKTLTNLVNGKSIDIDRALDITFQILEILGAIHEIGLLHRDIKPDNIIVDKNDRVFLIDFGLCRIDSPDKGYKTPADKELGNRFLRLPEFGKGVKVPSSVSDITFVVGLLFYMLSGKSPHILLDENGNYPQQRGLLPDEVTKLTWAMYTFDRGFAQPIAQRFQNAKELVNFITHQRNPSQDLDDNPAEQFAMLLSTSDFKQKDTIINVLNEAHRQFIVGVNEVLNEHLVTGGSGPNSGDNQLSVVSSFYVVRNGYSGPLSHYNLTSTISKDFNTITYHCDFTNPEQQFGSHNSSEQERIIDDYRNLGRMRGKEAVRKLIALVKEAI